jgi:nitrite reductase (NADH) large subunit
MAERLLIVGNGMAGLRLVEELVRRAPHCYAITVVGKEPQAAYNRILLSSFLAGEVNESDVCLKDRDWYADHGITLVTGDPVEHLDAATHRARLASGREILFDRAVLATGSNPIRLPVPGADLAGVVTFRDLADAVALREITRRGGHAVVIGGGLLGIEAAYGLARAGVQVSLIHLMDRLMERQLDARAAAMLTQAIADLGIEVMLETKTTAILGSDRVAGIRFGDGRELPADLVVMAIGIRPEIKLAAAAGLPCGRGILVDDGLATAVPGFYALGECAEHRGVCYGLVEPCYAQARVLARCLAGETATYEGSVTATNLKVSGVPVFSAGDFLGGDGTQDVVLSDPGLPAYKKLVIRCTPAGQRLTGTVLFGDTADGLWYLDLIRSEAPIDPMHTDIIFGRDFVVAAA